MKNKQIGQLPEFTPGQRLKKLRMTAGLSQRQLSQILGFTSNYYGQVERDAKELSKNLADAVCRYFNVTYSYLYHGAGGSRQPAEEMRSRELLINYVKSCTEEECQGLEPMIRALVQALRDTNWLAEPDSHAAPDRPAESE